MNNPPLIDEKTEALLLGSIINSFSAASDVLLELNTDDFSNPKHQVIFQSAKEIFLKDYPIDLSSMLYSLKESRNLEKAGGAEYLFALANNTWSGSPYKEFLESIKNLSSLRKLQNCAKDALYKTQSKDANSEEIISELQTNLCKVQGISTKTFKSSKEVFTNFSEHGNFDKTLQWMRERALKGLPTYDGVSTGYKDLDHTLGFFRKSCIYYVGARTSMGKTTFMLNLIRNMVNRQKIGIFSLEMPAEIIMSKLNCLLSRVPYSLFEDGKLNQENVDRLIENVKSLENAHIYIEDPGSITIQTLSTRAKRMVSNYEIDVLFIDYLTRIRSSSKHLNKHLEVDEISKGLQSLAKEIQIPIICLAQLNRKAATEGKKPNLADFRESGSIEEDADACILLHRPEYYNPNEKPGIVQVIVAKNRLRGILKTIEFNCNRDESEVYNELGSIHDQIKNANNFKLEDRFEQSFKQGYYKDD